MDQVTQTGEPMLTEAYTDASTGKMILSAAAPIYAHNSSQIVGVAGVDISLDHINELFSSYKIGNKGFVNMLMSDGTMIYHPNKDYQMKTLSDVGVSDTVLKTLQAGKDAAVKYSTGSSNKYGYVQAIGQTGYYVLSCLPSSKYFSNLVRCLVITVLLLLIGIVAIIVAIRKVAGKITKPIIGLNNVAQ